MRPWAARPEEALRLAPLPPPQAAAPLRCVRLAEAGLQQLEPSIVVGAIVMGTVVIVIIIIPIMVSGAIMCILCSYTCTLWFCF